jgi:hypothetical protein
MEASKKADVSKDGYKCSTFNERGSVELFENRNPREAYYRFQKGMLGTGESEYSKALTHYFRECLEHFCSYERVEDYLGHFNMYLDELGERALIPRYYFMRISLSRLTGESREAGCISEAIRFQKEMIFFILLEGPQNEHIDEHCCLDYYMPFKVRLEKSIQELRSLIRTREGSGEK